MIPQRRAPFAAAWGVITVALLAAVPLRPTPTTTVAAGPPATPATAPAQGPTTTESPAQLDSVPVLVQSSVSNTDKAAHEAWIESLPPAVPASTTTAVTTTSTPTTTTTTTTPALDGDGCEVAAEAVRRAGGTPDEVRFATRIAKRESRCTLSAHNYSTRTHDDSWGPWQINYYGSLRSDRTKLVGPPESNVASWEQAGRNFLTLLRAAGACHWQPPDYCK